MDSNFNLNSVIKTFSCMENSFVYISELLIKHKEHDITRQVSQWLDYDMLMDMLMLMDMDLAQKILYVMSSKIPIHLFSKIRLCFRFLLQFLRGLIIYEPH